ncbi:MAG: hypothetical protein HC933_00795 [Pleurocapsa sp. SU_196_0]|nr:hypothetical protein [Pleurocapsa sp. SU_196_0]
MKLDSREPGTCYGCWQLSQSYTKGDGAKPCEAVCSCLEFQTPRTIGNTAAERPAWCPLDKEYKS